MALHTDRVDVHFIESSISCKDGADALLTFSISHIARNIMMTKYLQYVSDGYFINEK